MSNRRFTSINQPHNYAMQNIVVRHFPEKVCSYICFSVIPTFDNRLLSAPLLYSLIVSAVRHT
jgi:hypothetical protein